MEAVPAAARAWISGAVGAAVLSAWPAVRDPAAVPWGTTALLAAVGALGGLRPRRAPVPPALLLAVVLLPPAAAALAAVPGGLLSPARRPDREHPDDRRRLGRAALLALAAATAALSFGATRAALPSGPLGALPAVLAAALLLALPSAAFDGVLRAGRRPDARRPALLGPALGFALLHGPAALLAAELWRSAYGPVAALLVLLPHTVPARPAAGGRRERADRGATVRALVGAVDLKDHYTRGHGERVGLLALRIGRELGVAGDRLEALRIAGTLHDLGKLGVPTRVLRKDGPLTGEERRVIRLHPEYGDELVRGVAIPDEAREAILHHHERLDGSGYPHGLTGCRIPEAARIVAVADAFDAMTTTRTYSRARPVPAALAELRRCAGTQFDPRMVEALARTLERDGLPMVPTPDETAVPDCGNVPLDHHATPPLPSPLAPDPDRPPGPRPPEESTGEHSYSRPRLVPDRDRPPGTVCCPPSCRRPGPPVTAGSGARLVRAVHLLAGGGALLALAWTAVHGLQQPRTACAYGLLVALGGVAGRRPEPLGVRGGSPVGAAGSLAYALLAHGVPQTVAVVFASSLVGLSGAAGRPDRLARRLAATALVTGCRPALLGAGPAAPGPACALSLLLLLVLAVLADAALAAALARARAGCRYPAALRAELRALSATAPAVCATAVVAALAPAVTGPWVLPVCCLPLFALWLAGGCGEAPGRCPPAVASLARATDLAGCTPAGHARRVAALSRAVGRELGMAERDLAVVEYAALMHDVGQLSLVDPVPAGATEPLPAEERRRLARLGGSVARLAPLDAAVAPAVADAVERQADPYREQPLAARVVRTANAYDELTAPAGPGGPVRGGRGESARALERLRRATAYDHEPRVVEALARVLARGAPVRPDP
ncbi:HD-GYP domain-containing protein [Streptomyces sp. CA-181903]|uniref:HD-GYP domain-containing protein n=1 Tax=Streptomyces sp. CA-181903 TaxID=3240055 RepID=UPI003D94557E